MPERGIQPVSESSADRIHPASRRKYNAPEAMSEHQPRTLDLARVRPAQMCELLLTSIEVAEGRRKRRPRNTTPDNIGLQLKLDLLQACITADPEPADFEAWLLEQAVAGREAPGPVRAVCSDIMFEWQTALGDPYYRDWLLSGPEDTEDPS